MAQDDLDHETSLVTEASDAPDDDTAPAPETEDDTEPDDAASDMDDGEASDDDDDSEDDASDDERAAEAGGGKDGKSKDGGGKDPGRGGGGRRSGRTPPYDPVDSYNPEKEFAQIVEERDAVDENLGLITTPFAESLVVVFWVATGLIIYSAVFMPLMEATGYFGIWPHYGVRLSLILGVPILAILGLLLWRYEFLRVQLKWAKVNLERYVDDAVCNKFEQDNRGFSNGIHSIASSSNAALVGLLRLRMRAFQCWHRISIHHVMVGVKMRGTLEANFFSPRFFVAMAPAVTVLVFFAMHLGIALNQGLFSPENGSVWTAIWAPVVHFASALWDPKLTITSWGLALPSVAIMAIGYGISRFAYEIALRARQHVIDEVQIYVDTKGTLAPHTYDRSREILERHKVLHTVFRSLLLYGRSHPHGGPAGEAGFINNLLERFKDDMGEEFDPKKDLAPRSTGSSGTREPSRFVPPRPPAGPSSVTDLEAVDAAHAPALAEMEADRVIGKRRGDRSS